MESIMALIDTYTSREKQTYLNQAMTNLRNVITLVRSQERHFAESVRINMQPYGDGFLTGQIEDQEQAITELLENITKILNTDSLSYYKWQLVAGSNERLSALVIVETTHPEYRIGFKDWNGNASSVLYWMKDNDEIRIRLPDEGEDAIATVVSVNATGGGSHPHTAVVSGLSSDFIRSLP